MIQCTLSLNHEGHILEEDLRKVFGDFNPVPEYEDFNPVFKYAAPTRRRRELHNHPQRLQFKALGKNFDFKLVPNEDVFSDNFAYLERWRNSSSLVASEEKGWEVNPLFIGEDGDSKIAVSLGYPMFGVVKGLTEDLVIQPLPYHIRRKRNRKKRTTITLEDHIISRRSHDDQCALEDDDSNNPPSRPHERAPLFERGSLWRHTDSTKNRDGPSGGSSVNSFHKHNRRRYEDLYIETAIFVDKDLFRHMKMNFPSNTKQQILQFVLAMVNAVQLLYNDPSLGHRIKFVLKRLEILYDDPPGLERRFNIDEFLTNFCNWQNEENPPTDSHPLHWDHAVILTGMDLYTISPRGTVNSLVVGLAPVTGMCTASNSCTVNEGRHFESVYVVTHEIGHNLNMKHDGVQAGNNCDPGSYLMSPTLGSGKITWSLCSRDYLDQFLTTPQAECLRDAATPKTAFLNHEWWELPGQRFSADLQCTLKHGKGSYHAYETQSLNDVCEDLHCRRDHYSWTSHPALEGTTCGMAKWCRRGECVRSLESSPTTSNLNVDASTQNLYNSRPLTSSSPFDGEWQKWSDCKSLCLYGVDGLLSSGSTGISMSERRCSDCKGQYRYRACSAVWQCSAMKRRTLQDFADEACSMLAYEDFKFIGRAERIQSSGLVGCDIKCLVNTGGSVLTRKSYPDGTVCNSPSHYPAYCIKGMCTEFRCEPEALYGAEPHICRPDAGRPDSHKPLGPFRPFGSTARPVVKPDFNKPLRPFGPVASTAAPFTSTSSLNLFGESLSSISSSILADGTWGPWLPTSTCRASCIEDSRGIQLVRRDCKIQPCRGLDRNIQLCDPISNKCTSPQNAFQHATDVCLKYQKEVIELSGIGLQLASTPDDPDRPCTVACQDKTLHYRFYRVNGRGGWFPFGTDCTKDNSDRKSYCLNGKCLEFTSDGTPVREMLREGRISREMPDIEVSETTLTQLPENVYDYKPKTEPKKEIPMTASFHTLVSMRNPINGRESRLLRINKHHKKREVGVSYHRISGSFDDEFLHSIIHEFNQTLRGNVEGVGASSVDLANPVHVDMSFINSSINVLGQHPIHVLDKQGQEKATWKVVKTPCSVTCGEGIEEVIIYCEAAQRRSRALDSSASLDQLSGPVQCEGLPPDKEGYRSCSTDISCQQSDDPQIKEPSRIGKWLTKEFRLAKGIT